MLSDYELFKTSDLEDFLKEHEGEWWSPGEIRKKLGVDLRTLKNVIRRFNEMNHEGYRFEIAERILLYAIRMIRDTESSRDPVKSRADGKRVRVRKSSKGRQTLLKPVQ